jgi:riboflavin transporter FmnP
VSRLVVASRYSAVQPKVFPLLLKGENDMKTNSVTNESKTLYTTKKMVLIGMFAALSYVLMFVRLPYKHLGFLEFEFSDVPAAIATLAYGPVAGIIIELIKNLIKALTATDSAGVGELANFIVSCAFILPVGLLYKIRNNRKTDKINTSKASANLYLILTFAIGVITMAVTGALMNYFVVIPLYAKLFGGMEVVFGAASASVPVIKDLAGLILLGITPFNIAKGIMISIVGYYTYRFLRKIIL